MPLSLKTVYKQPPIDGDCSYAVDRETDLAKSKQFSSNPIAGGQSDDSFSEDRAVAVWPGFEEDKKENATAGDNLDYQAGHDAYNRGGLLEDIDQSGPIDEQKLSPEEIEKAILKEKMDQCIQEGYEKGKAKAEKECLVMQEEASAKLKEAKSSLDESRRRSEEIIAASEKKIVELAVAVAERLVRKHLEIDPEAITGTVRETMNILNGGEQVEVYVNPSDLDPCLTAREQLKDEFKEIIKLDIFADENMPRGSCRVESESGVSEYIIDQEKNQLEQQLLRIARKEESGQAEEE